MASSQVSGPGQNETKGQAEDLGDRNETNVASHSTNLNIYWREVTLKMKESPDT